MGPLVPAPGPGQGEGARVSVLQCGGALPLPALRCVRHQLQRGPRARWGRDKRGRGVLTGGAQLPATHLPRTRCIASSHSRRPQRPLGEKGPPPLQSEVLALCFFPPVLPQGLGSSDFVLSVAPGVPAPAAAAHTVLSSIHSVLVKARRARTEPSPSSPSSPATPPPATSRCGVDRWRFVRRARRG